MRANVGFMFTMAHRKKSATSRSEKGAKSLKIAQCGISTAVAVFFGRAIRSYEIITDPDPRAIRNHDAWAELHVIGKCNTARTVNGQTSCEVRYFIGSKRCSARQYGKAMRNHWGIENNLHWQMDVTFGEDASRIQDRHGSENFAMLRRLALGLLKQHPSKESIRCKRYEAALDINFLEEVLRG